jgi:hypothetical protein
VAFALSTAATAAASSCAVWQRCRRPGRSPSLPQTLAVFAEAGRLAYPRRQGLPQDQVQPFDHGCTNPKAQVGQALGSQHNARAERQQFALLLLFDQLPVEQSRMWLTDRLVWASPLARARKRRHDVEGGDERRQIPRASVAEARRELGL